MADYTVISDVGASLVRLLREHMTPEPVAQPEFIGLAPPSDKGDLALSLFLYRVEEDADSRQTTMINRGPGALQYPPVSLSLHYMLTAHSAAELPSRASDEHLILGRAMQVLHDHSTLRGSMLEGSLGKAGDELRIVMNYVPLDVMIGLFPDVPYKLSLSYMVGPVRLDSTRTKPVKRVLETNFVVRGE